MVTHPWIERAWCDTGLYGKFLFPTVTLVIEDLEIHVIAARPELKFWPICDSELPEEWVSCSWNELIRRL